MVNSSWLQILWGRATGSRCKNIQVKTLTTGSVGYGTKPLIVLVHGMGNHPKPGHGVEGFSHEFKQAANDILNQFKGFKSKKIENLADVEEINYDGFFNKIRKDIAERAGSITEVLEGMSGLDGIDTLPGTVFKLAALEPKYGDDEFFYTHVLDVVFYMTVLGGRVRTDVGRQFTALIEKYPESDVYIVAHSLGTAVMHDTLAKLYTGDFNALGSIANLDQMTHRIRSLWMLANVSQWVNAITGISDPLKSAVKPTPDGCTVSMNVVRHKLDSFTWFKTFDPPNDGSWIPQDEFDANFRSIVTSEITDFNTHSFGEYIKTPRVAVPLFEELFSKFAPGANEIRTVQQVCNDRDGEQTSETESPGWATIAIEWAGVNWWRAKVPFGVSVTSTYVDRASADDVGTGMTFHFYNKYSIGMVRHGDKNAVFVSFDIVRLFQDKSKQLESFKNKMK